MHAPMLLVTARITRSLPGLLLGCLLGAGSAGAHDCGPAQIEVKAGRSYFWRIHADRTETLSQYIPVVAGPAGTVEVFPRKVFFAHHGDFIITGLQPGTNQLVVNWFYPRTPAAGICAVTLVVVPDDGKPDFQSQHLSGELVTRPGEPAISAVQLNSLITNSIPDAALKLLVFAQCYGGNLALSPLFRDAKNTAISSGTSPNQQGRYGGFHDDAARGFRPEAGRTALDLHEDGSAGKSTIWAERADATGSQGEIFAWSEWPRMSGGLPLGSFPLDPVTPDGAVRSRHIVIFAGRPTVMKEDVLTQNGITIPEEGGVQQTFSDAADRDQIRTNFQGQANTTIRTVGGRPSFTQYVPFINNSGVDGWDYPGDLDGLKRAIEEAGTAIRNAPDPSKEQFILYVADHGEQGVPLSKTRTAVAPHSTAAVGSNAVLPASQDPLSGTLQRQPDNQPQLRVQVAPGTRRSWGPTAGGLPSIAPGDVGLRLLPDGGAPVILEEFRADVVDLDDDGDLGSLPGEGLWLHFPVPEPQILTNLLGRALTIEAVNHGNRLLEFSDLTLLTGGIAADNGDPQPHLDDVRQRGPSELELSLGGLPRRRYTVETSTDLVRWTLLKEHTLSAFADTVVIPIGPDPGHRFVRVLKAEP
ncbi:MAG: hypothetical protein J0L84_04895 [Verrucomicrobia bacterium]|nr:hypothetical protein [Verrucomicrobiota bacterium]